MVELEYKENLAPIVLFTYNRPEHTRQTLESLARNVDAEKSDLYIFCDGPKTNASDEVLNRIEAVKEVVRSKKWTQNVIIKESIINKGLAKNVIEGVTEVVNKCGKVIVLEDDLLLSDHFLTYMNTALNLYENESKVQQISGFLFPFETERKSSSFFMPVTNTIGWGTWKKEWNEIDLTASGYEELNRDRGLRYRFNLEGSYNYSQMLLKQMKDENFGSWAILYWWHVFNNDGLVLYPDYPLVQHNDFDHSGTHSGADDHYTQKEWRDDYNIMTFPEIIRINKINFNKLKNHQRANSRFSFNNLKIKIKNFFS